MSATLCLVGERVFHAGSLVPATVVIREGRIESVRQGRSPDPSLPLFDAEHAVVMPGLVDGHVHLNEPGRAAWEGFFTGTRAAAAGGVTTLVDMPLNCIPVTTSKSALDAKLASTEGQLHVDVGFWGGVVPGNTADLAELASAGVLGCKAFLVHSGIDEFPNVGEADLRQAMRALRNAGLPLLAHAELDLGGEAPSGDPRHYATYLASRPRSWEDAAIALLIRLSEETGCSVHIVHLSSSTALPLLEEARSRGVPITVETCPHYLCLAAEEVPEGGTVFKCAPPIREDENRKALWEGLARGLIDAVVTDHSPCTADLKRRGGCSFLEAWGGISSLELGLPAIWTEARSRGFGIESLVRWMAETPARIAGLSRKGRIEPGGDADLVIWDPEASFVAKAEALHFRNKHTPYEGRSLHGVVERTYLRGQLVYDRNRTDPFGAALGRPLLHRETLTT